MLDSGFSPQDDAYLEIPSVISGFFLCTEIMVRALLCIKLMSFITSLFAALKGYRLSVINLWLDTQNTFLLLLVAFLPFSAKENLLNLSVNLMTCYT